MIAEETAQRAVSRVRASVLRTILDGMKALVGDANVEQAHRDADEGLRLALMTVAGNDEVGHLLAEIDAAYEQVTREYGR